MRLQIPSYLNHRSHASLLSCGFYPRSGERDCDYITHKITIWMWKVSQELTAVSRCYCQIIRSSLECMIKFMQYLKTRLMWDIWPSPKPASKTLRVLEQLGHHFQHISPLLPLCTNSAELTVSNWRTFSGQSGWANGWKVMTAERRREREQKVRYLWIWALKCFSEKMEMWGKSNSSAGKKPTLRVIFPFCPGLLAVPSEPRWVSLSIRTAPLDTPNKRMWLYSNAWFCRSLTPSLKMQCHLRWLHQESPRWIITVATIRPHKKA